MDRGSGSGPATGSGWSGGRRGRRSLPVVGLFLVTASLLVSACGGGTSGSATSTAASTPTRPTTPTTPNTAAAARSVPPAPSTGCGSPAVPGTVTLTPVVDGRSRTAVVHLPSRYQVGVPVPLVVNLHGSQSTALQQSAFTGMDATADADTFMVVYPQGAIVAGTGFEWNVPGQPLFGGAPVPATVPNDVSFLEQLVTMLEQKYCVDRNRVFATGFSGGARMASQLGCDASTVFAAIAPVSGLRLPSPCASARPVPVVSFHGTADPVDPYDGNGQAYWTYSVPTASARWAAHDRCPPGPATSHPADGVTLTAYAPCAAGTAVELYTIAGAGHEWPGGPPLPRAATRVFGRQSTAIDASATMWSFFMAHPL